MPMKAILEGNAGNYRLRGAIWELGASAYRGYVHLVPVAPYSRLSRSVGSAEGATMQQALGAAEEEVRSTVGQPGGKPGSDSGCVGAADTRTSVFGRTRVAPVTIDYSMAQGPGGWKVYDVTLGGVSLITAYRKISPPRCETAASTD